MLVISDTVTKGRAWCSPPTALHIPSPNGAHPCLLAAATSALFSSSSSHTCTCPDQAAWCNGVHLPRATPPHPPRLPAPRASPRPHWYPNHRWGTHPNDQSERLEGMLSSCGRNLSRKFITSSAACTLSPNNAMSYSFCKHLLIS